MTDQAYFIVYCCYVQKHNIMLFCNTCIMTFFFSPTSIVRIYRIVRFLLWYHIVPFGYRYIPGRQVKKKKGRILKKQQTQNHIDISAQGSAGILGHITLDAKTVCRTHPQNVSLFQQSLSDNLLKQTLEWSEGSKRHLVFISLSSGSYTSVGFLWEQSRIGYLNAGYSRKCSGKKKKQHLQRWK